MNIGGIKYQYNQYNTTVFLICKNKQNNSIFGPVKHRTTLYSPTTKKYKQQHTTKQPKTKHSQQQQISDNPHKKTNNPPHHKPKQ